jgi:succinate-semialdehyde dehydrogenase/glutarate-semialdehyde dehydrogenase
MRTQHLTALAGLLTRHATALQRLITDEVGTASCGEVVKCAAYLRWLAANAEEILAPRRIGDGACIHYDPLGVVAGIMPWNFPLWQVIRFAAGALVAGNRVVVKHSPLVPRCAEALNEMFLDAGFIDFSCASGPASDAERLIADGRVRLVVFTGCAESGRKVAALAGQHLKRCILELGGSDAFIVMPDADVARAARIGAASRMRVNGQACTAAKRFIIHDAVAGEFERLFVEAVQAADIGPLVNEAAADRLERQVRDSIAAGAALLCGGTRLGPRTFAPTVLAVQSVDLPVMQQETFGPVAPILRVRDLDEAVAAANATRYGLSASLWTRTNVGEFRARLGVGQLFVNTAASSRFDLPFGGTKDSGFGRALGAAGLYELVNVKAVMSSRA